jgi:glutamate-1-semialdehyde 2,1-aminomutase
VTRTIDRRKLADALRAELAAFEAAHPRSRALFEAAKAHLHDGVPMSWMIRWAGAFPLFVERASGARFTDVDGREYVDFCLGDTGAMTGHAPPAAVAAIKARLDRGVTFMLPTEDALAVSEELARRFGLPFWQAAMTATDANRFVIRIARMITGRPKVLVFNWCYHGTVDETFATLTARSGRAPATSGRRSTRRSPPGWSSSTTWRRSSGSSPTATWPASSPSRP